MAAAANSIPIVFELDPALASLGFNSDNIYVSFFDSPQGTGPNPGSGASFSNNYYISNGSISSLALQTGGTVGNYSISQLNANLGQANQYLAQTTTPLASSNVSLAGLINNPGIFLSDYSGGRIYVSLGQQLAYSGTGVPGAGTPSDPAFNTLYQYFEPYVGTPNNLADLSYVDHFSFPISLQAYDLNGNAKTGSSGGNPTSLSGGDASVIYAALAANATPPPEPAWTRQFPNYNYPYTNSAVTSEIYPRRLIAPGLANPSAGLIPKPASNPFLTPAYYTSGYDRFGGYMSNLADYNVTTLIQGGYNGVTGVSSPTIFQQKTNYNFTATFHTAISSIADKSKQLNIGNSYPSIGGGYADPQAFPWSSWTPDPSDSNMTTSNVEIGDNNYIDLDGSLPGISATNTYKIRIHWLPSGPTASGSLLSGWTGLSGAASIYGANPSYELFTYQGGTQSNHQSYVGNENDVIAEIIGDLVSGFNWGYLGSQYRVPDPVTGTPTAIGDLPSYKWFISQNQIDPFTNAIAQSNGPAFTIFGSTAQSITNPVTWPGPEAAWKQVFWNDWMSTLSTPSQGGPGANGKLTDAYSFAYSDRLGGTFVDFNSADTGYLKVVIGVPPAELTTGYLSDVKLVYKLFNQTTGDYLITTSKAEQDALTGLPSNGAKQWIIDTSYQSPLNSGQPLYRFFQSQTGLHFYTAELSEKEQLISNSELGFNYEGEVGNVYAAGSAAVGSGPVSRFYNANTNQHFYAFDQLQVDALAKLPSNQYEGIAYRI